MKLRSTRWRHPRKSLRPRPADVDHLGEFWASVRRRSIPADLRRGFGRRTGLDADRHENVGLTSPV